MAHQFPKRCCDRGVVITLCGPPVASVWPMGSYLWCLSSVWPQCYHCMAGGYVLVVLTPSCPIVTTIWLVGIYLGAYSMCGPIVTCTTV